MPSFVQQLSLELGRATHQEWSGSGALTTTQHQMAGHWSCTALRVTWMHPVDQDSPGAQRDCRLSIAYGTANHVPHLLQWLAYVPIWMVSILPPISSFQGCSSPSGVKFLCNPGIPILAKLPV